MLSRDQYEEFERSGLVRVRGAISRTDAAEMCDRVWSFLYEKHAIERDDPATWTVECPTGFQPLARSGAFERADNPVVRDAVEALIGGGPQCREQGRVLVTFPQPDTAWEVPSSAWHIDYVPLQEGDGVRSIQMFAMLNDVRPRGGGTLILAGSHQLTARYVAATGNEPRPRAMRSILGSAHPWLSELWNDEAKFGSGNSDRIRRYMEEGAVIDGVRLQVVELSGAPGDVFIMHSDCFHSLAPNCLAVPRMMLTSVIRRDK